MIQYRIIHDYSPRASVVRLPSLLVFVNKHTPDNNTFGTISFRSTTSGAGLQFLPLDRVANARVKKNSASFTDTGSWPVRREQHDP